MLPALVITILTMSPGSDVFARFGHTAILVEEEADARVYNFGAYKGSDPHIVSQFLHNAIPYYLSLNDLARFEWKYGDRDVIGQRLDLDEKEARAVMDRLEWTLKPEHRNYQYDWFRSNCTTKTRDLVDATLGGVWQAQLQGKAARVHRTIRSLMVDALWTVPSVATLFSITLNHRGDVPLDGWQELAMPADLMRGLAEAHRADGRPLVAEEWLWRGPAPRPPRQAGWLQPLAEALLLYLLFLGAFARGRWARVAGGVGLCAWGAVSVLLSLWFVFWSIVPYPDGNYTVNLLGYSPLGVLFIAGGVRLLRGRPGGEWPRRALAIVCLSLVIEIGFSRQQHLRYAAYAWLASGLAWLALRAGSRVEAPWADKAQS